MHILLVHNDYGRFSGEEVAVNGIANLLETGGHRASWFRESAADIEVSAGKKIRAFLPAFTMPAARARMGRILDTESIDLVQI